MHEYSQRLADGQPSNESLPPLWYSQILTQLPLRDQVGVRRLRDFFNHQPRPQFWYYPCSGIDITPVIVAPYQTTHLFVDLEYDGSHESYHDERENMVAYFVSPFTRAGGQVVLSSSWEEAFSRKKQMICIDSATSINLVGENTNKIDLEPETVDTLYSNSTYGMQIIDTLPLLKKGGFYVTTIPALSNIADVPDDLAKQYYRYQISLGQNVQKAYSQTFAGLTLEDLGFVLREVIETQNMHIPQIYPVKEVGFETTNYFHIFEKTRSFTAEEKEILEQIALLAS